MEKTEPPQSKTTPDWSKYDPTKHKLRPEVDQMTAKITPMEVMSAPAALYRTLRGLQPPKKRPGRPTSRQRNTYCVCGSGRKGKDCCFKD